MDKNIEKKISELREKLNLLVSELDDYGRIPTDELLKLSQELDEVMNKYYDSKKD